MDNRVPAILNKNELTMFTSIDIEERIVLERASNLMKDGYPEHSLLDLWTASVHNLRRRVEAYGVELFLSNISNETGRKSYKKDGDTLSERWGGVDDYVLIAGAKNIRILNRKAAKALEMINWMRNHASPAHDSDEKVETEEVLGLALIVQKSLFESAMPNPGNSPVGIFNIIKAEDITDEKKIMTIEQINCLKNTDIKTIFGYMVDKIYVGEEPEYLNSMYFFPHVWEKATEDLRISLGEKYQSLLLDDEDTDIRTRFVELLLNLNGVKYIPDYARSVLYKKMTKDLKSAKNTAYGWSDENAASIALSQLGTHVPDSIFEEVYQEILAVWCGNFWGRSDAYYHLDEFITCLDSRRALKVVRLFKNNERVKSELYQDKPKRRAKDLLERLKEKLTIQTHINEVDKIIDELE